MQPLTIDNAALGTGEELRRLTRELARHASLWAREEFHTNIAADPCPSAITTRHVGRDLRGAFYEACQSMERSARLIRRQLGEAADRAGDYNPTFILRVSREPSEMGCALVLTWATTVPREKKF